MADIVERLINYRPENEWGDGVHHTICTEAAGEIKSLQADLFAKETEALGYLRAVGTLQAEVRKLGKALEQSRSVLAMMIDPDTIMETNVLNAYALAVSAEASARAALTEGKEGGEDGNT